MPIIMSAYMFRESHNHGILLVLRKVNSVLEEEVRYFKESVDEWLKRFPGKIALVKGSELIGVYDTEVEALSEGARRFRLQSFLVRRIAREQATVSIPALTLGILSANTSHAT